MLLWFTLLWLYKWSGWIWMKGLLKWMKARGFCSKVHNYLVVVIQSCPESCPTLCDPMDRSMPGFPVLHHLSQFAQTLVHWVGDAIQPPHPVSPLHLPSIFPSMRVFSTESAFCIRWPKYWSFSFSISPSSEYSGLISLGLTGLISLLSKGLSRVFSSTTVQKYQFFNAQPSLWFKSHTHTWLLKNTIALTVQTCVGKVMSLLFNTLSSLVIAFLPRSVF